MAAVCSWKMSKCWIGEITSITTRCPFLGAMSTDGLPIHLTIGTTSILWMWFFLQIVILSRCVISLVLILLYLSNLTSSHGVARSTIEEYSDENCKLAQRILSCISESLGLPPQFLVEAVGEPSQNIVINYYPPCPQPDLTLGLQVPSAFHDWCFLSICTTSTFQKRDSKADLFFEGLV